LIKLFSIGEGKLLMKTTRVLFLAFILGTMLAIPIATAYPYEDIFKKDLFDIANSILQIQSINIYGWLDSRPSGHLWASIRINYTAGLSDDEKISIQDQVQYQLESKSYIDIVERNYIETVPEGPPPPWPGFVIGELNVAFKESAVGGSSFSVYKPASLAPYVALLSITVIIAAVATVVYAKRFRRRKEKQ
jgi:hypothetical protein